MYAKPMFHKPKYLCYMKIYIYLFIYLYVVQ